MFINSVKQAKQNFWKLWPWLEWQVNHFMSEDSKKHYKNGYKIQVGKVHNHLYTQRKIFRFIFLHSFKKLNFTKNCKSKIDLSYTVSEFQCMYISVYFINKKSTLNVEQNWAWLFAMTCYCPSILGTLQIFYSSSSNIISTTFIHFYKYTHFPLNYNERIKSLLDEKSIGN